MEILLIRKFKKSFGTIILIGIICAGLIVGIIAAGILNSSLNSKVSLLEKKLFVFKKTFSSNPEKAIEDKKILNRQLIDNNKKINSLFKKTIKASSTPLSFKQSMFSAQDKLKKKAFKKKMGLPLWLGFDEYKIKVPNAEITDILTQELIMVEELINAALDSGVSSIDNIKLSHQSFSLILAAQNFKYVPVSLSIKSDSRPMKEFLMNISKSPCVFGVQKLKVKTIDRNKNLLSTEITLNFIEI